MVSLLNETPVDVRKIAKKLPGDRSVGVSTIYRWCLRGCTASDGTRVQLESIRIGGRRCTTREAVLRFFAALDSRTAAAPCPAPQEQADKQLAVFSAEAMAEGL